jgi:uncharacterized phage-associated protein
MDKIADIPRVMAPVLFVLAQTGKMDKHRLFKILYFADKDHIAKYARPLSDDFYIAMANGPVPSRLYDYIRILEGKSYLPVNVDFINALSGYIRIEAPYNVIGAKEPEIDFLSQSAIKSLEESMNLYKNKSFPQLTDLSHDAAWLAAEKNTEMSLIEIAKAAGVNDEMLKFIQESM